MGKNYVRLPLVGTNEKMIPGAVFVAIGKSGIEVIREPELGTWLYANWQALSSYSCYILANA